MTLRATQTIIMHGNTKIYDAKQCQGPALLPPTPSQPFSSPRSSHLSFTKAARTYNDSKLCIEHNVCEVLTLIGSLGVCRGVVSQLDPYAVTTLTLKYN